MNPSISTQVADLIGRTPLVRLDVLSPPGGATILGKLENLNPSGSVKDRPALGMIRVAEASGQLKPGTTIVEATSGNTGISLAMLCAKSDYNLILTMPETMSFERRSLVQRYGAQVVLTPGADDMTGAVQKANEILDQNPGCIQLKQFENPANPEMHRKTTGPEILEATRGEITAFVAGVGTGGTITGVGEVLKAAVPQAQVIAVEPAGSAVLSGKPPSPHAIEGIGPGFIPSILNRDVIDDVIAVRDEDAFAMSGLLASKESLVVGISSGANVLAAQQVARKLPPRDTVVTILCDSGARYFSIEEYFRRDDSELAGTLL